MLAMYTYMPDKHLVTYGGEQLCQEDGHINIHSNTAVNSHYAFTKARTTAGTHAACGYLCS